MVAHVIFRLAVGGLENGVVNIVNNMENHAYRHAIVCMDKSSSFEERIKSTRVGVHEIHKKPGRDWGASMRLYKLFRKLRPSIVHTRNIGALDAILPAIAARVPVRIHGEHGLDIWDLNVKKLKYQLIRRFHAPFINHFIAVSRQLDDYLRERVGIKSNRITRISNGVDQDRFSPPRNKAESRRRLSAAIKEETIVVGTVGRLEAVKDPLNLLRAVAHACSKEPTLQSKLQLVFVGDGSLKDELHSQAAHFGLSENVLLTGARDDVPEVLRAFDVFVSPSLAEGSSNTILEAMASGLPVVATDVGDNSNLVAEGESGRIVPRADPEALAAALSDYLRSPQKMRSDGVNARLAIEQNFSISRMVSDYRSVYDACLGRSRMSTERMR